MDSFEPSDGFADPQAAFSRLAAIISGSSDAIVSKTLDGVVQTWNPAAEKMFGYSAGEIIGSPLRVLIPDDRQQEETDFLVRLSRGEAVSNFTTVRLRKNGDRFPVAVTISPIRDSNEKIVGASKIARDLSETQRAREQLRESEERLSILADNISQLAWMADPDGHIFWYNQRWFEFTGTTIEQVAGWGWRTVHHPDHVDRVVQRIQRSWDTGEPWEDTFPLRARDGSYRWFLSRALPIRDDAGKIVRWFGTNTDVTEHRLQQEQIELLMLEANHRVKNTLSLVQAIARQAAVTDTDREFVRKLTTRLTALATNQDVLVTAGWRGGDAETLIRAQLSHFSDLLDTRIQLQGPKLQLTTSAVQVLGMALHELATNAGKYGALSVDSGQIVVAWRRDHTVGQFRIEWIEIGGPEVRAPDHTGFGTIVLGKLAKRGLFAEVSVEYLPSGLQWRLNCPEHFAIVDVHENTDARG